MCVCVCVRAYVCVCVVVVCMCGIVSVCVYVGVGIHGQLPPSNGEPWVMIKVAEVAITYCVMYVV